MHIDPIFADRGWSNEVCKLPNLGTLGYRGLVTGTFPFSAIRLVSATLPYEA